MNGTSDPCPSMPNGPGPTTDGCVVTGQLSRLLTTDTPWSEHMLLEGWCNQFPSHAPGALDFGADEKLYVSGGEGASFNAGDWGQLGGTVQIPGQPPGTFYTPKNPCADAPHAAGTGHTKPTAQGGALRSQSPRRALGQPRLLSGAILRVDPMTGEAVPDNPLFSSADPVERRIIGYGLRNPFRMIVKPGTSEVWIGDVGWSTWEELNHIPDLTEARNFGWPCFEGNAVQYTGLNICPTFGQTTPPVFTYNHSASAVDGDGCTTGSSSVAGMAFYQGDSNYPAAYDNALFFSDYSRRCLWVMFPDGDGNPDPETRAAFASSARGPVDLQIGPDGNLYYVDFDGGRIMRVEFGPVAVASGAPLTGGAPLTVNFSSAGSAPAQPDETITFAWDLDGDGAFDDSADPNPTFVYTDPGTYTVRLKVTDNHGGSNVSDPVDVTPGNEHPTAFIDAPSETLTWQVDEEITFAGHATDPQQGTLAPAALSWVVRIHHCPSNCHTHPYVAFNGVTGGSFPAPDHEYPSFLEVQLTATDAGGLQHTRSAFIHPKTVNLQFESVPMGVQLSAGTFTGPTPFTRETILGSNVGVEAPSPQDENVFASWSDGGSQEHTIVASASASYTATYTAGLPAPWIHQGIGAVGAPGSASLVAGTFTVDGSGADIELRADEFHYVYQPIAGDFTAVARVVSVENTNPWAKAGVMIRATTADLSRNALMAVTPANGLTFQRRQFNGGVTASTTGIPAAAPHWVRLDRSGNTVYAYSSPNGTAWSFVGSTLLNNLPATVLVGLAVTSHDDGVVNTSVFDNVLITPGVVPTLTPTPTRTPTSTRTPTFTRTPSRTPTASRTPILHGDTDATRGDADTDRHTDVDPHADARPRPRRRRPPAGDADAHGDRFTHADRVTPRRHSPLRRRRLRPRRPTATAVPTPTLTPTPGGSNVPPTRLVDLADRRLSLHGAGFDHAVRRRLRLGRNRHAASTSTMASTLVGTDTTAPYSVTWSDAGAGAHNLTAVAVDNQLASANVAGDPDQRSGRSPAGCIRTSARSAPPAARATPAGAFSVVASGADIATSADEFHFVYVPVSGNATIVARVAAIQNTSPWAKGGVMFRESLAANSRHASMFLTRANGLQFQRRTTTGAVPPERRWPAGRRALLGQARPFRRDVHRLGLARRRRLDLRRIRHLHDAVQPLRRSRADQPQRRGAQYVGVRQRLPADGLRERLADADRLLARARLRCSVARRRIDQRLRRRRRWDGQPGRLLPGRRADRHATRPRPTASTRRVWRRVPTPSRRSPPTISTRRRSLRRSA